MVISSFPYRPHIAYNAQTVIWSRGVVNLIGNVRKNFAPAGWRTKSALDLRSVGGEFMRWVRLSSEGRSGFIVTQE